jgi:hypothetical protein
MSKHVKLEVNLVFSEKINTDEDIQEIVTNVLNGLVREVDGIPENSDVFTMRIEVNEPFSGANDKYCFM